MKRPWTGDRHPSPAGDKHPLATDKHPLTGDGCPLGGGWMVEGLGQAAVAFALSAAKVGGLYAPWALAAVAASRGRGLWPLLGAAAGALVFFDFQTGLRFAASAVLICCANLAFCDTKLWERRGYCPALAAGALLLVQSVYLVGRGAVPWALAVTAAAVAGAAALAMEQQRRPMALLTAAVAALSGLSWQGLSPGGAAAGCLALVCAGGAPPLQAAALGAAVGLCADLSGSAPVLVLTAVCGCGGASASLLRQQHRLWQVLVFCLWALILPLALDADRPWLLLGQLAAGGLAYALLPRRWLADRPSASDAVPAMAVRAAPSGAAAVRAVYDAMFRTRPAGQGENPSVIFDHAAEQVCRDCLLVQRCWQTEYGSTYNAFNDACTPMLKRGRALAEDFPLFFTSRCLHFPELLTAVNMEVYAFRLRRQYRARLERARALAEAQYDQLGEALSSTPPAPEEAALTLRCRVGTLLRPRQGETLCGDQLAVFTVGPVLYMLLSDGMGSGSAAHAESAMTVRLLRQFLKAGIQPAPALKTLNTALTLRCQEGGGFTTIDLLALDRRSGSATLYKYGAAASYVRKGGAVTRLEAGSLPAGLQDAHQPPEATAVHLTADSLLVMVSDGVTARGDDWLRTLLAQWPGSDSRELAQLILAESRRHGGLEDDCAALVLRLEKSGGNRAGRV